MKVAIMQPYVFPYIGYFQLIKAVDLFVAYDDVQYIRKGWINRNRILVNGDAYLFTVPCIKASQNKLIKDIYVDHASRELKNLKKTIEAAYNKAPYFEEVNQLVQRVLTVQADTSIAELALASVGEVCRYIALPAQIKVSSESGYANTDLKRGDRLIDIVQKEKGTDYINAIGGQELYTKEQFGEHGINLQFLKPLPVLYPQFSHSFVPWLSIIDVLMFNAPEKVNQMLDAYALV